MKKLLFALLFAATRAFAQQAHPDLTAIMDNSFLLEEAYNQDPGVVQHISMFTIDRDTDTWALSFTQEWPAPSLKHQFSYSIPVIDNDLGNIALNYRYQLAGDTGAKVAMTPRFTVYLPNGDGSDGGLETAFAISRIIAPRVIGHSNLVLTHLDGETTFTAGQSLIYALNARVHLMAEALASDGDFVINPGVRWVHNLRSGLQIVPGISVPLGEGSTGLLFYLSFEK